MRDLLALSSDYDSTDKATQMFFAETQNKLLYAVTEHTAAEIITSRADASLPNMGLTSWEGSVVRKKDIIIAKNYLLESELDSLNRLVDIFLTSAEERVKNRHDLTMDFWKKNVDALLNFQGKPLLQDRGRISKARADEYAGRIYEEFDARRRQQEAAEADAEDLAELGELEKQLIMSKRNADNSFSD